MTNSITGTQNPLVLPSAYRGYGVASKDLPPLLSLPKEVLDLITVHMIYQHSPLIPLRFVCKRLANLPLVKAQSDTIRELTIKTAEAERAIAQGNISLVEWYHERLHYPLTYESSVAATKGGNLAMFQWLYEKECPWDARTTTELSKGGHLAVLQWARAHGCPWNDGTCTAAIKEGHLAILQWAHANGCSLDVEGACTDAARGGHLEVLQWAHANGCPWNENTWDNAHESVRAWLRENGCPGADE